MAKMGSYEIGKLKSNILDGFYRKREAELAVRRTVIAKKNRELQLAPMQYLLELVRRRSMQSFQ